MKTKLAICVASVIVFASAPSRSVGADAEGATSLQAPDAAVSNGVAEVVSAEAWEGMFRSVPANATRTRHYYRVSTGEQFTGDAGLEALSSRRLAGRRLAGGGVAAGGEEDPDDPVYSCTPPLTNNLLFVPGANRLIADDITTVAVGGCDLEAFELILGGGGDGSGPGFGVDFALYNGCPGGGGQPIAGTTGQMSFAGDGLHMLVVDLHDSPVPMNKSYYVAITFDTDDSGWIAGVPAATGFTENQFHHPFFPCTARFPGATVYAGFYYVADCGPTEREFLAYRDANVFGVRLNLGTNTWIIDDIQLIGGIENNTCILSSYDVAGVGIGTPFNPVPFTITAELRTGCEPQTVIEGTQRTFEAVGDGLAEVAQFEFSEPVQLPPGQQLVLAFKYSAPALAILAGDPDLGFTAPFFTLTPAPAGFCEDLQGNPLPCSQCLLLTIDTAGFFASIRCLGNAPVGACCDLAGLSPAGDDPEADLCRNVKEIACKGALSRYETGVKCPGTCSGSFDRCAVDAECPEGQTCALDSPFDTPCGFSACCKPPFPNQSDEGCEDLNKADCLALFDDLACTDEFGVRALACEGVGDPCTTDEDCPGNDTCDPKICLNDAVCNACADSGDPCVADEDCAKECGSKLCSTSATSCVADKDCPKDEQCIGVPAKLCSATFAPCVVDDDCGTCSNTGISCQSDEDCTDGTCIPSGETCISLPCASQSDCLGTCSSAAGGTCQFDSDCDMGFTCNISACVAVEECVMSETTCEPSEEAHQAVWQTAQVCFEGEQNCVRWVCRFALGNCDEIHENTPGCNVAACCDDICDQDPFCCDIGWDGTCVNRATGAEGGSPCAGIASNDDCFASRECSDESGICATTADCNQCAESGLPCMVNDDCRACTNTGAPCQTDEGCTGGMCIPSAETCFLSGATCVESISGARQLNTCSGACNTIVRACEHDDDCNHCNVNKEIHCDNDGDCPFLQTCVETALCDVDNPRSPCATTADCDEEGEECFARSGALGAIMPVDTGSSNPLAGEVFCCHRNAPGLSALGSVWGKFIATSTSAELSTCSSNGADATDSIIEVYSTEFDKECSDTGAPCFDDGDCAGGLCEPSNRVACETRVPIACNDNILVGCGGEPNNSKACVTGLEIGATYLVQVAAMSAPLDKYSLRLRSPCPGNIPTAPPNDHCKTAVVVLNGSWPYDLTDATMDCPYVGTDCLPPIVDDPENPYAMTNDVWFNYFVTQNGLVTIQTCAGSPQTTPDTTLVVYEGMDCPVTLERQVVGGCNDDAEDSECGGGSSVRFNVLVNQSYRIRIGGKEGSEPSGMLTISVTPDCQANGREDYLDIDCGAGNFCRACNLSGLPCVSNLDCPMGEFCAGQLITGSGDCNGNTRPDECDISFLIEFDCNSNGRPDSCDIACGAGNACGYCSITGILCSSDGDCPGGETCNGPMLTGSDDVDGNGEPDDCGCPDGAVVFLNPNGAPDGDWYDARQPHDLNDAGILQGRDTFTVTAPAGADLNNGQCWELCETDNNPALHVGLGPNSITAVNSLGGGLYDIVLARPIAQGEVTRLRYLTTGATAWFRYLPGDVNLDGTTAPADILAVIDCLNGVAGFACNLSNTDTDRSNEAGPPDILRVIDLLNAASAFETWLDAQINITGCE